MLSRWLGLLLALSLSVALSGCLGTGSSSPQSKTGPTVTSISLSPQNSALTVSKTLQFSAQATYSDGSTHDITSSATWQTSDSTVATVNAGNVSGIKPGVIQVRVSSGNGAGAVSVTAILNVTSKNFNKASLKGGYVFSLTTALAAPNLQLEVGSFTADGNGNITGVEDMNGPSGAAKDVSLSGNYSITADGRGILTLTSSGQSARTLRLVLSANSATPGDNNGALIEFDGAHNALGTLEKQDSSALANTALANRSYVFRTGGLDASGHPMASIGLFTADSSGITVSGGREDINDNGTINNGAGAANSVSVTGGTISTVDGNSGRASLSLTTGAGTSNYEIYVVSASKIEIVGIDNDPAIGHAEMQAQPAPGSISAGGYLLQTDIGGIAGQFWQAGQVAVDSTSHFTAGLMTQDGGVNAVFVNPAGSITVGAGGRATFQQATSAGSLNCTFYMISSSKMYLLQTNDAHAGAGLLELQAPGPDGFTSPTLNNTFAASGAELGDGNVAFVQQLVSDGMGHVVGIADVSQPQSGNPAQLVTSTVVINATYPAPNSIGGVTFNVSSPGLGVAALSVLLQSPSSAAFVGVPNDVDGWLVTQ